LYGFNEKILFAICFVPVIVPQDMRFFYVSHL
jgi:hypothetical protein